LAVDPDVYLIGARSESTRAQIVDVVTAIDSKVRARVGGAGVNGLVGFPYDPVTDPGHSDGRRPLGESCVPKLNQRAERSPAAASEASARDEALALALVSAPKSQLALPSVSRLALQPALPSLLELESEAPLQWA
jgi:hypothetical protein